ncbi:hypothetical protein HDU79_002318 [Rhizoclosmatium sp. JEL0117]|nr:hypothetical protein HDU79_002318 [Rhizoclosmatium sp. JEL0117]
MLFSFLPFELVAHIIENLDSFEQIRIQRVSKQFQACVLTASVARKGVDLVPGSKGYRLESTVPDDSDNLLFFAPLSIQSAYAGSNIVKYLTSIRWGERNLPHPFPNPLPLPTPLFTLTNLGSLALRNCNIVATLPDAFQLMTGLTTLDLSCNPTLTGQLPNSLFTLPRLEKLYLAETGISGVIPPELGDLKTLLHLSLFNTRLTGPIPKEIGKLTELVSLHLFGNGLCGRIPVELFANCKKLRRLHLQSNPKLEGPIPLDIGGLVELEELDLSDCCIGGYIPKELGLCVELEWIWLNDCSLVGQVPMELKDTLRGVKCIELKGNTGLRCMFEWDVLEI